MSTNENGFIAFVLMPFDSQLDRIYEDLIVPPLEEAGFEVIRADDVLDQQSILKDIVRNIHKADLVLADLTFLNPNVFYELGIAHGLRKPTVMFTQDIEEVPFDLRSYRIIPYSESYREALEFKDNLSKIAISFKEGSIGFGNPVTDFLPSAPDAAEISIERERVLEEEAQPAEIIGEDESPGFLDFLVEGIGALEEISEHMESIGGSINTVTDDINTHTAEVEAAKGNPTRLHKISKAMALDMIKFSIDIENKLPLFQLAWEGMAENTTNLISVVRIESPEDREQMLSFESQIKELQQTILNTLNSSREARDAMIQHLKGISRDLNRGVKRTEGAIDGIIAQFSRGESYLARILNLISERLDTENGGDHDSTGI